jgi:hypothetical protein
VSLEDRIHQDPKNPELRLRIARLYRKYGDESRAANQYAVCLSLNPADNGVRTEMNSYLLGIRKRQLPPKGAPGPTQGAPAAGSNGAGPASDPRQAAVRG